MRSREEVLDELIWREIQIENLNQKLETDNEDEEHLRWCAERLHIIIYWLKWFLNEK